MSNFKFEKGQRKKIKQRGIILTIIQSIGMFVLTLGIITLAILLVMPGRIDQKFSEMGEYIKTAVGIKRETPNVENNSILNEENKNSSILPNNESVETNTNNVTNQEPGKLETTAAVNTVDIQSQLPKTAQPAIRTSDNSQAPAQDQHVNTNVVDKKYENNLYYSQLNDYGKIIYNKLSNESAYFLNGFHSFEFGSTFNDLLSQPNGTEQLNLAFQAAVNALVLDYPQLFFIEVGNISLGIRSTRVPPFNTVHSVSITNTTVNNASKSFFADGLNTRQDVENVRNKLEELRTEVLTKARENSRNTVEYIRYIHDFVTGRIEYDDSIQDNTKYNLYSAALYGRAVCEGYAKLTKYLLDGAGIPTVIVVGDGINSRGGKERHAWNLVYLNNKWYGIDTTWDDPIMLNGGELPAKERYRYFLVGRRQFEGNHKEDGNISPNIYFSYPEIAPTRFGE